MFLFSFFLAFMVANEMQFYLGIQEESWSRKNWKISIL